MLPVLRHVTLSSHSSDVVEEEYSSPFWIPVATQYIDELHFEIRTFDGEELPFQYGAVTMVLAFKRDTGL